LADALLKAFRLVPPGGVIRQQIDLGQGQAQRFADIGALAAGNCTILEEGSS